MGLTSFADIKKVLPVGWDLVQNRSIYTERKEPNGDADNELLSVTQDRGIIKQSDYEVKKDGSNEDKSKYKVIYENDIVYNKMRMWQGAVGLSPYKGIVSPAYVVLVPRRDIVPEYFYLQMKTKEYISQSYAQSYGLCDDMNSLRYEDFRNMLSICPPKATQKKIVNFLDEKLAKIDKFIVNKQEFIEKLIERKQAIINDAVTKGDSPAEYTKPSKIEWLGNIPLDWKVYPVKHLAFINTTALSDKTDPDKVFMYVDISSVNSDGEIVKKEAFKFKDAPSRARRVVSDGDTIISTVRTYLRAIGYIHRPEDNLIVSTGFAVCSPRKNLVDKEFLQYAVRSNYFIENVVSNSYGVSYPAITAEKLGCHKIVLPGNIEEQKKIVLFIKAETAIVDKAIEKAKQQINLIKDYRDSLITHAVTGQIEIKE